MSPPGQALTARLALPSQRLAQPKQENKKPEENSLCHLPAAGRCGRRELPIAGVLLLNIIVLLVYFSSLKVEAT